MMRLLLSRLAPFALALAIAACSGGDGTTPSPSPSPVPSAAPAPSPGSSPSTCSATVTDLPSSIPARGGVFTFGVAVGSTCAWSARTDVTWADVTPGSGQGSGRPLLQVGEHTRLDTRTLTVTVNGRAFAITQNGIGCVYTVNPVTLEVADQGGQVSFSLSTMAGCSWSAASSVGWITVGTPTGSGGGSIILQVAANVGDVRQGFVTIAGQRVTITQRRG